jgi:hypothetical protein
MAAVNTGVQGLFDMISFPLAIYPIMELTRHQNTDRSENLVVVFCRLVGNYSL